MVDCDVYWVVVEGEGRGGVMIIGCKYTKTKQNLALGMAEKLNGILMFSIVLPSRQKKISVQQQ